MMKSRGLNRYQALIETLFFKRFKGGSTLVQWSRKEMESAAVELGISLPKNLGDVIYSFRYRNPLPKSILKTQPIGMEWIIEGVGRSLYQFKLTAINRIAPNSNLHAIKIPDATPEIIATHALSDEQSLLAKVRYNRLVDLFLGLTAYSMQNHLRTTVRGLGQIEIDEIYVALDRNGCQYILPVQAKGGKDQLSTVQAKQDLACCVEKFPGLVCRSISAQFLENNVIAMFELCLDEMGTVKVVEERHYKLVPSEEIDATDLERYRPRFH